MTIALPEQRSPKQSHPLPLVHGEPLDQPTFHARYEAMPPETRAELVGGKVIMSSPVSAPHSGPHLLIGGWLLHYAAAVPGLRGDDNLTTILGPATEVQPDLLLRVLPEYGGAAREDDHGYLHGPVELVVEVAASTGNYDLKSRKRDYELAGVKEYIVFLPLDSVVHWFWLMGGTYQEQPPGPDGIFRSRVFPGLWLDPAAIFRRDFARVREVVDQGLQSAEHLAWVVRPKG